MNEPLVSVIIPIYNTADYLGYCLNSLVSQTYQNWQGILIDDGSTDGSRDIAQRYTQLDPRFTLHCVPNGGVSKARNWGLEYASGKYLHFLDSDDVLAPETLERQVRTAEDTGKQLIVSDVLITDFTDPQHRGPRLSAKFLPHKPAELNAEAFRKQRMQLIWHTALLEGLYGKLYDRSLWERLKLRFPEEISLGEDFLTNLLYYAACNGVVFLQQIGHYYNNIEGSDSLTHRYRPNLFWEKMHLMEALWTHLHTDSTPDEAERICFYNYAAGTGLLCIHELLQNTAMSKSQKRKHLAAMCKHPIFADSLPKAEYLPPAYEDYVPLIISGRIRELLRYVHQKRRPQGLPMVLPPYVPPLITALLLLLTLTQLELSCGRTEGFSAPVFLLNICTLLAIRNLFQLFLSRPWLSNLLLTVLSTVIAAVNYYVIRFKGSPLSFLELRNLGTAMNVLDGYHFPITPTITAILVIGGIGIALCLLHRKSHHTPETPWLLRKSALLLTVLLTLEVGYFGSDALKPRQTIGWLWREAYTQYGYTPCTVESFLALFHAVTVPEGYDEAAMDSAEIPAAESAQANTPDIILILNETFYDLSLITDLNTDRDYFTSSHMDNVYTGYAVVPAYGGGTNSSEYELLTSNSMALLPGITPFNSLDLTGANSIVSHLSALGYDTLGAHSESGANYYRGRSYPALGFDRIYFDEDFQSKRYYYDRYYESDESLYANLIRWYEEMSDGPRFCYLLTIQNHGSWDHNPSEYDTVLAQSDYGEYDDDVDEYLTSVAQSDEAFRSLTEHYEAIDRPVIICMVGDHCPNFAEQIADSRYSEEELQLLYRSTPLLIWANYDLDLPSRDLGTMSLNFLVPTLLDMAGVPLSPYYQTMLTLKKDVPIITSYGSCYNTQGLPYTGSTDVLRNYFHWEYNNLSDHRRQRFFSPYS